MRMCIVGNGPSAREYRKEIDKCDFVVRLNAFPPGKFGRKWNAWASSFSPWSHMQPEAIRYKLFDLMPKNLQVWVIGSPPAKWGYAQYRAGNKSIKLSPPGWTPMTFSARNVGVEIGRWTGAYIRTVDRSRRFSPSTGFQVLAYALTLQPKELIVVGFDAIAEGQPGWGDAWNPRFGPAASVGHNFPVEKRVMQEWLKTRSFCGRSFRRTKPTWWRLKKHVPMPVVRAVRQETESGFQYDMQLKAANGWPSIGVFSVTPGGEVTIFVRKQFRGRHLSATLVHAGTRAIEADAPKLAITAFIPPDHPSAQRAFERAGWLGRRKKAKGQRPRVLVKRNGKTFIKYTPDSRFWRAAGKRAKKARKKRRPRGYLGRRMWKIRETDARRKKIGVRVVEPRPLPGRTKHKRGVPQRVYAVGHHERIRQKVSRTQRKKRRA